MLNNNQIDKISVSIGYLTSLKTLLLGDNKFAVSFKTVGDSVWCMLYVHSVSDVVVVGL